MSTYHAPLQEMTFVLNELAGLAQVASLPGFEEASPDTVNAILEEAAKFATNVLDPLNSPGDREGATRRIAHQHQPQDRCCSRRDRTTEQPAPQRAAPQRPTTHRSARGLAVLGNGCGRGISHAAPR